MDPKKDVDDAKDADAGRPSSAQMNPDWKAAIEKAMHASLVSGAAGPDLSTTPSSTKPQRSSPRPFAAAGAGAGSDDSDADLSTPMPSPTRGGTAASPPGAAGGAGILPQFMRPPVARAPSIFDMPLPSSSSMSHGFVEKLGAANAADATKIPPSPPSSFSFRSTSSSSGASSRRPRARSRHGGNRSPPPPPPLARRSSRPPPAPPRGGAHRNRRGHGHGVSAERLEHNDKLEREEKMELLSKLQFFVIEKGFRPFRELCVDDAIEDIRYEVYRAQRDHSKKRNVKMMQKGLVTVAAGIEMINRRYNWLNLRLDGYSKSVLLSIREYDDIFEELHWKYCDAMSMPVEMKLLVTLASSVWFFHMSGGVGAAGPSSSPPAPAPAPAPAPRPYAAPPPSPPPSPPPPVVASPPRATSVAHQQHEHAQSRMSGPRLGPRMMAPPPPPSMAMGMGGMDVGGLLSGLSMVQTLLNATG